MSGKKVYKFQKLKLNTPDYKSSPKIRLAVQLFFLIATLYTGWRFVLFVNSLNSGGEVVSRPPGVEAFLPISSLMALKYWLLTGDFNPIHPAGLVLFLAFVVMGLFLKRTFCSWVCPVALLSEYLWKGGQKIFGKNLTMPRWLDYPLRSLKYLILIFFAWGIFMDMGAEDLRNFIYGSYNRIADIKMMLFFVHITIFSLMVIILLMLLSVVIKNFWCRYLCPYGALMGFLGLFSPAKITRNPDTCTDCRACTESCPASIQVHSKTRIRSDECTACLTCTSVCPELNTLSFKIYKQKKSMSDRMVALLVVLIFVLFTGVARFTGYWQNNITNKEYKARIKELNNPEYNHTGE